MDALTLFAVLGAALAHAVWNALVKSGGDPLRNSTGLNLAWVMLGGPLLFVVPLPGAAAAPLLAVSGLLHVLYFTVLTRAYRMSDFSVVYPIARGLPPVAVLAAAVLLGEDALNLGAACGVAVVSVGVASLARGVDAAHRRGVALSLLTAALIAAYTLVDGIGARRASTPASFLVWLTALQGCGFCSLAVATQGRAVLPRSRVEVVRALGSGGLAAAGYLVVLWAMARAPIGLVSAVRESGVLFGALLGVLALREPLGRRRLVSAVLISAGMALIQLSG